MPRGFGPHLAAVYVKSLGLDAPGEEEKCDASPATRGSINNDDEPDEPEKTQEDSSCDEQSSMPVVGWRPSRGAAVDTARPHKLSTSVFADCIRNHAQPVEMEQPFVEASGSGDTFSQASDSGDTLSSSFDSTDANVPLSCGVANVPLSSPVEPNARARHGSKLGSKKEHLQHMPAAAETLSMTVENSWPAGCKNWACDLAVTIVECNWRGFVPLLVILGAVVLIVFSGTALPSNRPKHETTSGGSFDSAGF